MIERTVGILLFDDVETLDFAGPFEVFSVAEDDQGRNPFDVVTIAGSREVVYAVGGLKVMPDVGLRQAPEIDVLVVPGGVGTINAMDNPELVKWIVARSDAAEVLMSVCSGARLLAKAGLLSGLPVTTHHQVVDDLASLEPTATIDASRRYIDTGRVVTTAGISAAIDGSLYLVKRLVGEPIARATACYMEYEWKPEANPVVTPYG